MSGGKKKGWEGGAARAGLLAISVGVWLGLCAGPVSAQDDEDFSRYHSGLVPTPNAEYQNFPETPRYRAFLPDEMDLSSSFPKPGDQGAQGSCTGWAVGYAARSYYARAVEARNLSVPANIASPAYLYDMVRQSTDCDSGAEVYRVFDVLEHGALSASAYPYDQSLCRVPTTSQQSEATDFRIKSWYRVNSYNVDQVKGEIAQGNPVIFSLPLYPDFFRLRGREIYSDHGGQSRGYHALTAVGYDEHKQAIKFINSWGTGWGDGGFGWISYDLFRDDVREAYVMRLPSPPPAPVPDPSPPPRPGPHDDPAPVPVPDPPAIRCGSLALSSDKHTLIGYVGGDGDIGTAQAYADQNNLAFRVEERPWPQCEVLTTLNETLNRDDGPALLGGHEAAFTAGQTMTFDLQLPNQSSFMQMAYIQADGSVINLVQDNIAQLHQFQPGEVVHVGAGGNGLPRFKAGPPYGTEMLVVVTSNSPLFGETLPATEADREYLTVLRKAVFLHEQIADGGESDVRATYMAITTSEGAR